MNRYWVFHGKGTGSIQHRQCWVIMTARKHEMSHLDPENMWTSVVGLECFRYDVQMRRNDRAKGILVGFLCSKIVLYLT